MERREAGTAGLLQSGTYRIVPDAVSGLGPFQYLDVPLQVKKQPGEGAHYNGTQGKFQPKVFSRTFIQPLAPA